MRLDAPCRFLHGVGPARAEALERLGIRTAEDLLLHLPRRYFDRSRVSRLRDLQPGMDACVRVRVESLQGNPGWRGRRTLVATVADDTARLRVVWFNAWPSQALQPGRRVLLAGPVVAMGGRLEMRQPEFEPLDEDERRDALHGGRIVPLYPLTRGVSQKWLRALVDRALQETRDEVQEILPPSVRGDLPERAAALAAVHYPETPEAAALARHRLVFEELFFLQLLLARRRAQAALRPHPLRADPSRGLHTPYLATLSFRLTAAQERVLEEVVHDLESGRWMRRLVQGDVGAGKTVIAAAALFLVAGNGWQGALMAPTEALALQHAERLVAPCAALGVRLGVLVGSRSERDKEQVRAQLACGELDLVVGTHALVQEGTEFANLGLAVVDEQQRFGVLQRGALQRGPRPPHVLVLTATPIPRSLALVLFGDLDVSLLDEKPPGRLPVRTRLVPPERRTAMLGFVRGELEAGRRAFCVLPVIDPSEATELRAATVEFEHLQLELPGLRIGLLHGRLPAAEREARLADFRTGALQLLVCTSVVEVGLDVADASLMIVYHPERFGLSQLHQLRGRVGRGQAEAWCLLLADAELGDEARARLAAFATTDDGFRIAELDLELRGSGDLLGTRQHGLPELHVADLARDQAVLLAARDAAQALVHSDPTLARPEHAAARAYLESRWAELASLAEIG